VQRRLVEHPSQLGQVNQQQHKQIRQMHKQLAILIQAQQVAMIKRKKPRSKTFIRIYLIKRKRTRAEHQQHQKIQVLQPHQQALRTEETHNRNSHDRQRYFLKPWRVLLSYQLSSG